MPAALERLHDLQLLLWLYAGKDQGLVTQRIQGGPPFLARLGQLRPGYDLIHFLSKPECTCDGERSGRVVACNHGYPNPSLMAGFNCAVDFGAQWIDHADQADEGEPAQVFLREDWIGRA